MIEHGALVDGTLVGQLARVDRGRHVEQNAALDSRRTAGRFAPQHVEQALELLGQWPYPVVAQLRDSQAYVMLTGLGKSLFDYHSLQVREHQDDWQPLLKWLKRA